MKQFFDKYSWLIISLLIGVLNCLVIKLLLELKISVGVTYLIGYSFGVMTVLIAVWLKISEYKKALSEDETL